MPTAFRFAMCAFGVFSVIIPTAYGWDPRLALATLALGLLVEGMGLGNVTVGELFGGEHAGNAPAASGHRTPRTA